MLLSLEMLETVDTLETALETLETFDSNHTTGLTVCRTLLDKIPVIKLSWDSFNHKLVFPWGVSLCDC